MHALITGLCVVQAGGMERVGRFLRSCRGGSGDSPAPLRVTIGSPCIVKAALRSIEDRTPAGNRAQLQPAANLFRKHWKSFADNAGLPVLPSQFA